MEDGGAIILNLVIGGIMGAIASAIASNKGRSAVGWFFGGFFLGIIGIIIVAVLSDLNVEQDRITRDQEEKRRLREQLRQEQLKSESYRQYTMERLDAHDDHLGIDTKQTTALPPGQAQAPTASNFIEVQPTPEPIKQNPYHEHEWYYSNGNEAQNGPLSFREIQQLYAAGEITDVSLVWSQVLSDWTSAKDIPELKSIV